MPISGAVAKRIEVERIEACRPRNMPPLRPAKTLPFIAHSVVSRRALAGEPHSGGVRRRI
jgi:hypothetical protein